MKLLNRLSVNTRQLLMAMASVAVVCSCVGVGLLGNSHLSSSSETAFVAKDVVADILPPPMYLIETRLVLSQALEGTLSPQEATKEVDRLEKEYEARVKYWQTNPPFGLEQHLLGAQHDRALAFMAAAKQLVGRLANGEPDAVRAELVAAHKLYQTHREAVDQTVKAGNALAERSMQDFAQTGQEARLALLGILSLGLVVLSALGWWISRSIVQPLSRAVNVAESVAAGDLSVKVEVEGDDEPAKLLQALNRMAHSLGQMVGDVGRSSQQVAQASAQINTGNADLMSRTAAHQHELKTARASLTEVVSIVEKNAAAAQSASELVKTVSSTAEQGVMAMTEMTSTMDNISVSANRVAEIVGVIESIAFQTNILALNAAVEAARAGEQGRGFAVVATEVRQLANRASQAAREIKALAQDSVTQVTSGNQLAQGASQAIRDMVVQVDKMSVLVKGIWETTFAQSSGINMLGDVVGTLADTADSNVTLVSRNTHLASELDANAQSLQASVQRFRVEHALHH